MLRVATWLLAAWFTPAAFAQDRPCDVTLGTNQIDYGRLSRATLPADAYGGFSLPTRTVALHVRCSEPRDMVVFFRGLAAAAEDFRFTGQGRFALHLRDGVLDGARVDLAQVDHQAGVPGEVGRALAWRPGQGLAPWAGGSVARGRDFSALMVIEATVDEGALRVSDAARWSATGSIDIGPAAESPDLTLQADVQPGRCDVDVLRHLSFGQLRSTELDNRGASTPIPSKGNGQIQVLCDAPMPFAFRVRSDERTGSVAAPAGIATSYPAARLFGLGRTPAGQAIGSYVLRWAATATTDRGELRAITSSDDGRSWSFAGDAVMASHAETERVGYVDTAASAAMGPAAVKALRVDLDATIYIAPKHTLSLGEEIQADGLVTFEIIY